MSEIETEPHAPRAIEGWPSRPIAASDDVWRVPKRPAIVVTLILLAVWLVPNLGSFAPPETVSLTIVNGTNAQRIAAVIDTENPLSPRSEQQSLLIPANTRVAVQNLPKGMVVTVLAFDEECHLLTPWPFGASPEMKPGLAAFIADDGIAYWGDAGDGSDVPEGQASSKGCR